MEGLFMKYYFAFGFMGLALGVAAGAAGLAQAQGVQTSGARLLEFDGIAGQIEVRTSPGAQFNVEIIPGRKMTATLERDGITLRVKGPLSQSNMRSSCQNWGSGDRGPSSMTINGTRYEPGDLPRIIISGPDNMGLRIKRSLVHGQIGNVGGATINHASCGDLALGNVAQDLETNVSASGDFRAGNIGGKAEANVAGSGDVQIGSVGSDLELNAAGSGDTRVDTVGGKAEINLAGSGDVEVASVNQQTEVNIAGSGDVELRAGRSQLSANIAGSGNIRHGGTAVNPAVSIVGSGDVIVARLEGQPRVSKLGSGEFRVN
jgi:hypothetical protein